MSIVFLISLILFDIVTVHINIRFGVFLLEFLRFEFVCRQQHSITKFAFFGYFERLLQPRLFEQVFIRNFLVLYIVLFNL